MENDLKKTLRSFKTSLKNLKKDQLLILILSGILLLVIALPAGKAQEPSEEPENDQLSVNEISSEQTSYAAYMEQHLEQVLSQMEGVGDVTVMITFQSTSEKIVEKDVETQNETISESDSQGGTRTTQNSNFGETTVYDGENNQEPYVSKEISPQVEGVVVLASGGDNAVVKQQITNAVQALFGIDTHKIIIMKKNQS